MTTLDDIRRLMPDELYPVHLALLVLWPMPDDAATDEEIDALYFDEGSPVG